ncbi:hypothetical protein NEFER03_1957 [Nematocida sp. LUAm3]|nr:hypothetical protein NEFER03_1957 [Nematocida sp. LUAm3]KAI5176041.1 hypothetical protein NEFER02_1875 [Nematocida sp. LUAm2]KAI5177085.1 hypothetical protein NEFER01_0360 [Nematocida sp. LUAm1]
MSRYLVRQSFLRLFSKKALVFFFTVFFLEVQASICNEKDIQAYKTRLSLAFVKSFLIGFDESSSSLNHSTLEPSKCYDLTESQYNSELQAFKEKIKITKNTNSYEVDISECSFCLHPASKIKSFEAFFFTTLKSASKIHCKKLSLHTHNHNEGLIFRLLEKIFCTSLDLHLNAESTDINCQEVEQIFFDSLNISSPNGTHTKFSDFPKNSLEENKPCTQICLTISEAFNIMQFTRFLKNGKIEKLILQTLDRQIFPFLAQLAFSSNYILEIANAQPRSKEEGKQNSTLEGFSKECAALYLPMEGLHNFITTKSLDYFIYKSQIKKLSIHWALLIKILNIRKKIVDNPIQKLEHLFIFSNSNNHPSVCNKLEEEQSIMQADVVELGFSNGIVFDNLAWVENLYRRYYLPKHGIKYTCLILTNLSEPKSLEDK